MSKIGFIGLGHMGNPMVRHLLHKQHEVKVYDVVPALIQPLVAHGAQPAQTLHDIASWAEVIISSVQTSQQVSDLCLGEQGIFVEAKPNLLFIDCSSIDIAMTRTLASEASRYHVAMLDAPVSGGVAAAEAGALTVMVGGSEDHFHRAKPILEAFGKKVIHAGPNGHGQAAKICNNLLLGISMIGVCEAFTLAHKLGLDQKIFFDISSNASGQCWSMTSYCPVPGILEHVPSNHQYTPGFMAKMMLKDLHLGQHAAELAQAAIPLGTLATELYELYVNQGNGEKDFSGIIQMIDTIKVVNQDN